MVLILTLIRHGESVGNLRREWAGWTDSSLTNHGMSQARALASSLSSTHFTAVYTSDLKRAQLTAEQLHTSQAHAPPLISSHLLREQNFGAAEGKPWAPIKNPKLTLRAHYAQGKFPMLFGRNDAYPLGECIDDVRRRAKRAWEELLEQHLLDGAAEEKGDVHVAVVSHGIFIRELIAVLYALGVGEGQKEGMRRDYGGMVNTGWTRVVVKHEVAEQQEEPSYLEDKDVDKPKPGLIVEVGRVNQQQHFHGLKRQKGGIASLPYDPAQTDIGSFFSAQGGKVKKEPVNPKQKLKPY